MYKCISSKVLNMIKRFSVLCSIILLALLSYNYAENELTPKWWQNADISDIKNRFKFQHSMNVTDRNNRTLLQLALIHSKDDRIPAYFINKNTTISHIDNFGNSTYYYALNNPNMSRISFYLYLFHSNAWTKKQLIAATKGDDNE